MLSLRQSSDPDTPTTPGKVRESWRGLGHGRVAWNGSDHESTATGRWKRREPKKYQIHNAKKQIKESITMTEYLEGRMNKLGLHFVF